MSKKLWLPASKAFDYIEVFVLIFLSFAAASAIFYVKTYLMIGATLFLSAFGFCLLYIKLSDLVEDIKSSVKIEELLKDSGCTTLLAGRTPAFSESFTKAVLLEKGVFTVDTEDFECRVDITDVYSRVKFYLLTYYEADSTLKAAIVIDASRVGQAGFVQIFSTP